MGLFLLLLFGHSEVAAIVAPAGFNKQSSVARELM